MLYLTAAFEVLADDSFRDVREVVDAPHAMLEFQVELDGIQVNGVDILTWNAAGQIVDVKVMIRPLQAIDVVRQQMMAVLERRGSAR